ncbi:uncharacterized protein GGS22DRAFT_153739 [Annulohypoxylon maeteangense]|uniref:uncharacterized protein n=1 Tax=Annulohypoxylon maeteangense TaxID=1927788 RepID=UPI00200850B8|nr:uncharacterized protein GGS22DRAFT_153739 [Annulohypoxylon maeteangense]KAI0889373.1 hypothetical protein GGS22DRAFT_153739 [Annulohypoxylon maeteangense]
MSRMLTSILVFAAAVLACEIPTDVLPNNITESFSIQVQNVSFPEIHNHFLNIWDWGGGDQHIFVSPAGNSTSELTLVDGVVTLPWDPIRRIVINGEYEPKDNTTKMFMTERGDPRAIFDVVYGCNPDTDALQTELAIKSRGDEELGGNVGVRPFNGNFDFRWTPEGNTAYDPERPWTKVTLVVVYP